jgi:long-chain acyl-CoA synthetase
MRSWKSAVEACAGQVPAALDPDEATLAVLAYTSGTTGTPKGAMLTHGQLLANQRQLDASAMQVGPDDVVLLALPLFHIYGLNVGMGPTIAGGGTLELVERFEPASSLALIAERGVTVVVGAPPMYVAWLNTPGSEEVDLSSVRLASSGAAPLPTKILHRCAEDLGLDVREGYGLTEAAPVVTTTAGLPAPAPGSVGRALDGVEVRVVDEGAQAEDGDPGRVQVRGDNVFSGYWERPAETALVLSPDRWLDTGDIGYLDEGLLYLVDRAKDLIIVSGFNVYPVEVEAALTTHPAVLQAAVIGVPHPYTGEAVKAFVVVDPDAEVTADELIGHSATLLARFKRPESVEFVADLPTLPTGKLHRRMLRPG